jgi:hypothetical protein
VRRAKQTAAAEGRALTSLIECLWARLSRPKRTDPPACGYRPSVGTVQLMASTWRTSQIKEIHTTDEDAAYRSGISGSSPDASFGLSEVVLSGFVRVVTHPRAHLRWWRGGGIVRGRLGRQLT